jgi:hypothetical protein
MTTSYSDSFASFSAAGLPDGGVAAALPLAERLQRRLLVRTVLSLVVGLLAGVLIGMAVIIANPTLHTRIAMIVHPPVPAAEQP